MKKCIFTHHNSDFTDDDMDKINDYISKGEKFEIAKPFKNINLI